MTQLSRRAILRGAAPAALSVAAAAALPAMASRPSGGNPTIAELFAEWRTLKEEESARDRHMAAVQATMPAEFRIGEGTPYRYPAEFPPELLAACNAWQKANCPADWEDQTNELSEAMCEVEREIAATPGRSLEDIAIKLWLHGCALEASYAQPLTDAEAYDPDGDLEQCQVLSALRDAERLSGSVWKWGAA